jgi:hypothetical protein
MSGTQLRDDDLELRAATEVKLRYVARSGRGTLEGKSGCVHLVRFQLRTAQSDEQKRFWQQVNVSLQHFHGGRKEVVCSTPRTLPLQCCNNRLKRINPVEV